MKREKRAKASEIEYIDVPHYENADYPYQFFIGGRGTGKTYTTLRFLLAMTLDLDNEHEAEVYNRIVEDCGYSIPNGQAYMWIRRTDKEFKILVSNNRLGDGGNPFEELNEKYDVNFGIHAINPNLAGIYRRERKSDGKDEPFGDPVGYACAMSSIAGIRGMSFHMVKRAVYDEFIPERHVKRMRAEGEAVLNAIETVGRNRELKGEPPLYVYFLSNSNDIYNPLMVDLGLVNHVERMVNRGKKDIYMPDRKCGIHLLDPAESFKTAKMKSSLYQFAKGTRFAEMSLDNKFVYNDFSGTGYRNVKGLKPLCRCEEITLFVEKSGQYMYASYCNAKVSKYKTDNKVDRMAWQRTYRKMCREFMERGQFYYETYDVKERVSEIMEF